MKQILLLLLILIATSVWSQPNNPIFKGSDGDGWANDLFAETGNNIYVGGSSDGWAANVFAEPGNDIYAGGAGDGWSEEFPATLFHLELLGISENTFGNLFSAYPNPTNAEINIALGNMYRLVRIEISNVYGQQILYRNYLETDAFKLKIDGAKGIYFLKITGDDKTATIKILKN